MKGLIPFRFFGIQSGKGKSKIEKQPGGLKWTEAEKVIK